MRHLAAALLAGSFALALSALPAAAESGHHWTYDGAGGPENWGTLSPDFAACAAGLQQSPVDLTAPIAASLPELSRDWVPYARWMVSNNGHTIQASASGAGGITLDGTRFELLQFHFHHPSEHAVAGERAPMEVHFVHRSAAGKLAVVGVMLTGGGAAGVLDQILKVAPHQTGAAEGGRLDPAALMPAEGGYWRYQGSLTTPPCSEVVSWTVMKAPVAVSDAAIAAFAELVPASARPLQPLNRRYLLTH